LKKWLINLIIGSNLLSIIYFGKFKKIFN